MKKFTKRLALLLVLAMVVTLVPANSAAAASIWSFAVSDEVYNVKDTVKLEKNQFIDIDLLYDGDPVDSSVYKVAYVSSDESVLWIDAKNGKARADKNGTMKTATGKATVSAQIENLITGAKATRVLYVEVGTKKAVADAAKVEISNKELADEALAIGGTIDLDSKMYDADGNAVSFDETKNYRGWFVSDSKIATIGLTDGVVTGVAAGEAKVVVATFASKADRAAATYATLKADAIRISDELTINVKGDTAAVTVTATGAQELTFVSSAAMADTAAVTVTRDGVTITHTKKLSDDKKTLVITTEGKMFAGTYTVKVGDLSATCAVENEKVTRIVLLDKDDYAFTNGDGKELYVYYEVYNQYGESVRETTSISWTASATGGVRTDITRGCLVISLGPNERTYGTQIYVTGVYTGNNYAVTESGLVKVGFATKAAKVELAGVFKKDAVTFEKSGTIPANFRDGEYGVAFRIYDLKGRLLDPSEVGSSNDSTYAGEINVVSLSPLYAMVQATNAFDVTIEGETYGAVYLSPSNYTEEGGIVNLQATSWTSGQSSPLTVTIEKTQILTSFTLLPPSGIIAEGDGNVEIGFQAFDQDGKAITSYRALNGELSFTPDNLVMYENNDGSASLKLDTNSYAATTDGIDKPEVLMAVITSSKTGNVSTSGNRVSSLSISIRDKAYPNTISGFGSGIETNTIQGNTVTSIKVHTNNNQKDGLTYLDQYGRVMKAEDVEKWFEVGGGRGILLTYKGDIFEVNELEEDDDDNKYMFGYANPLDLTAVYGKAGNTYAADTFTFQIVNEKGELSASKKLTLNNVNISYVRSFSYGTKHSGTMYEDGALDEWCWANGTMVNGGIVKIPATVPVSSVSGGSVRYWSAEPLTEKDSVFPNDGGFSANFEAQNPNAFLDQSGIDADGNTKHRTRSFDYQVVFYSHTIKEDRTVDETTKDSLSGTMTVDNKAPEPAKIEFSWAVSNGKATICANDGKIEFGGSYAWSANGTPAGLAICIDKVRDQYGRDDNPNITMDDIAVTISKIVENEDGILVDRPFTVVGNGALMNSGRGYIAGAEIGDTFVATFTIGKISESITITVGADCWAGFNSTASLYE